MASTVSLPSHSQPPHNNFMKWSTTQKPISISQVEDNQSAVISHDHHRAAEVESSEKKESMAASDHHHHRRPNFVIKFRIKKEENKTDDRRDCDVSNVDTTTTAVQSPTQTLVASDNGGGGDSSNQNIKPWNLRSSRKDQDHTVSAGAPSHESDQLGLGYVAEKLEKRKRSISIALSKEEIEADILAITGSKPTRKPKKRPKNVQRQLDKLFPGLCLKSITLDTYKIS
ncbi:hypothetical protein ACOSQ2_003768 [Xanthoceras sorbifolium]